MKIRNILLTLCLILVIIQANSTERVYKKYYNNLDPKARCLDGSPPLYYIHQGKQPNKVLLFVEGGGHCGGDTINQTLQNCYKRSLTKLGSSYLWPDQVTGQGRGYLDLDPQKNKFAEWTKIILGYCDGASHQGYRSKPIAYKNASLYFRGGAISRAQFQYLNLTYGIYQAEKFVFTGASAGGLNTYFWNSYLRSRVKNPQNFLIIPDSGIFLNFVSRKTGKSEVLIKLQNLYKIANKDQKIPVQQCGWKYPGKGWKCFFFQYLYQFLEGKYLIINSQYDSYAIQHVVKQSCLQRGLHTLTLTKCSIKQLFHIEKYRRKYLKMMKGFLQGHPQSSLWSIPCAQHIIATAHNYYDMNQLRVPHNQFGATIKETVERFVFDNQKMVNFELVPWPYNWRCAF